MQFTVKINMGVSHIKHLRYVIIYTMFKTYYMTLYGCPLLDYTGKTMDKFYVGWLLSIRRLFNIPRTTHKVFRWDELLYLKLNLIDSSNLHVSMTADKCMWLQTRWPAVACEHFYGSRASGDLHIAQPWITGANYQIYHHRRLLLWVYTYYQDIIYGCSIVILAKTMI